MDLSSEKIFALISSGKEFPVDFDDAWQWIGWTVKQTGKNVLLNNFEEGVDFLRETSKNCGRGRPGDQLVLTIDCFKSLAMMAGTEKGKQVRRYFLNCERELKHRLDEERKHWQDTIQKRLVSAMVSQEVVSRKPKFSDDFYELLYKKRGGDWEKRDPKKNRPACVGTWTNWTVYDRLLGGTEPGSVKDTLNQINPRVDGRRKDKHHWHLRELGEFHLSSQLEVVKAVARLSPDGNWDKFIRNIQKACPNGEQVQLNLLDMLESSDDSLD